MSRSERIRLMEKVLTHLKRCGLGGIDKDVTQMAVEWAANLAEEIDTYGEFTIIGAARAYARKPGASFAHCSEFLEEINRIRPKEAGGREECLRILREAERRAEAEQDAYIAAMTPEQRKRIDYLWSKHKGIVNYNRG